MSQKTPSPARRRSAARFSAVQALFQLELSEERTTADYVVREYSEFRLDGEGARDIDSEGSDLIDPDREFFADLVKGVRSHHRDIDSIIDSALEKGWTTKRLETVLRCVLRAGVFELMSREDVPPKVVINEYVDAAHAFFTESEPRLVNGVLDKVARTLREREMAARNDGGS